MKQELTTSSTQSSYNLPVRPYKSFFCLAGQARTTVARMSCPDLLLFLTHAFQTYLVFAQEVPTLQDGPSRAL